MSIIPESFVASSCQAVFLMLSSIMLTYTNSPNKIHYNFKTGPYGLFTGLVVDALNTRITIIYTFVGVNYYNHYLRIVINLT